MNPAGYERQMEKIKRIYAYKKIHTHYLLISWFSASHGRGFNLQNFNSTSWSHLLFGKNELLGTQRYMSKAVTSIIGS